MQGIFIRNLHKNIFKIDLKMKGNCRAQHDTTVTSQQEFLPAFYCNEVKLKNHNWGEGLGRLNELGSWII
jgi:hypothetical protein